MRRFISSSIRLRDDIQSAGPETRYYGVFEQFLSQTLQNSEVRSEGQFDGGRPDFRLYHQGETPLQERLYCLIEAKSHTTNLRQLITNDSNPANRNQLRRYLSEICPHLVLTNYWQYVHLQLIENEITIISQHNVASSLGEFWDLSTTGEANILAATQSFRDWFSIIENLDASLDTSFDGIVSALMNSYRSIYERLQRPFDDNADYETVRTSILNRVRSFLPNANENSLSMAAGQIFSICVLMKRRATGVDLLQDETNNIRDITLRTIYNDIRLNRTEFAINQDIERTSLVLCASNSDFKDNNYLESIMLEFMRRGEREFGTEELGLRVTPYEVVRFMIARVHHQLTERGGQFSQGLLADHKNNSQKRVRILDPCVGTGRFYIEVLRFIYNNTLSNKPEREPYAREAILRAIGTPNVPGRVYAFDLQPACVLFSIFQLQVLLDELKINEDIRPQIFTTDALEGWSGGAVGEGWMSPLEGDELIAHLSNPARININTVKQTTPIDVMIGNPPWDGSDTPNEGYQNLTAITTLINPWRDVYHAEKKARGQQNSSFLPDPYLGFIRVAMLKNNSQDRNMITSFVIPDSAAIAQTYCQMRGELMGENNVVFDMLGGQQRRSGRWQRGKIFAVDTGSCILTFEFSEEPTLRYRTIEPGSRTEKLASLKADAQDINNIQMVTANPHIDTWNNIFYSSLDAFEEWIPLSDICVVNKPAMEEGRNLSYIHLDPDRIKTRCRNWFFLDDFGQARNASESDNGHNFKLWTVDRSRYNHQEVHNRIIQVGGFSEDNLRTITVKPLNHVSAYYDHRVHKIWHEPVKEATLWMETSGWLVICGEIMRESHMDATFSPHFAGNRNVVSQNAQCIPLYYNLRESRLKSRSLEEIQRYCLLYGLPITMDGANGNQRRLTKNALIDSLPTFDNGALRLPNLSSDIFERIHGTLPDEIEQYGQTSEIVWGHVLAIMCSSEYSDLPVSSWGVGSRIPFAFGDDQYELVENSARLGQFIRDISTNTISDQFEDFQSSVAEWLGELIPTNVGGDPKLDIQLDGWCAKVTGKWKIDPRVKNSQIHSTDPIRTESEALQALAEIWGFEMDEICEALGGQQVSLCLNPDEEIILPPIPRAVYDFSIGGHGVLNNYLAWRDYYNLQRNIHADDIEQLRDVIHSITCLVLLGPRLAENLGSFIQFNE